MTLLSLLTLISYSILFSMLYSTVNAHCEMASFPGSDEIPHDTFIYYNPSVAQQIMCFDLSVEPGFFQMKPLSSECCSGYKYSDYVGGEPCWRADLYNNKYMYVIDTIKFNNMLDGQIMMCSYFNKINMNYTHTEYYFEIRPLNGACIKN